MTVVALFSPRVRFSRFAFNPRYIVYATGCVVATVTGCLVTKKTDTDADSAERQHNVAFLPPHIIQQGSCAKKLELYTLTCS